MPINRDVKYQGDQNKVQNVPKNTKFEEITINKMLDRQVEKYGEPEKQDQILFKF
jgi:hypothetical protein